MRGIQPVDERAERLIVRWLDGQIGAAELAELQKTLEADPAARRLLEQYRRNDDLSRRALAALVSGPAPVEMPWAGRLVRRGSTWLAWGMAVAAAVALCAWPAGRLLTRSAAGGLGGSERMAQVGSPPRPEAGPMRYGSEVRQPQYFGIYDEGRGELYLLESPQMDWDVVAASGEL
jgi:anti-sigma factor RsiW